MLLSLCCSLYVALFLCFISKESNYLCCWSSSLTYLLTLSHTHTHAHTHTHSHTFLHLHRHTHAHKHTLTPPLLAVSCVLGLRSLLCSYTRQRMSGGAGVWSHRSPQPITGDLLSPPCVQTISNPPHHSLRECVISVSYTHTHTHTHTVEWRPMSHDLGFDSFQETVTGW